MPKKTNKTKNTKTTKTTVVTIDGAVLIEDTQRKFDLLLETYEATRGPTKAEFDKTMDRVTDRLDRLELGYRLMSKDLSGVKSDVSVLKSDVSVLKSDVSVLKSDVAELKAGQTRIEAQLTDVAKVVKQHDAEIINLWSSVGASPRGHRP